MEKIYPIDIFGIKKIGVERWLEGYYLPVKGEECQNISVNILDEYLFTLKQFDNEMLYWLVVSNIKVVRDVYIYLISTLMLLRLQNKGFKYIIGRDKREIHKLLLNSDPLGLINFNKLFNDKLVSLTYRERAKNTLRLIKHNLSAFGFSNWNSIKNISAPFFLIGDRHTPEVYNFCKEKDIYPISFPVMLFSGNRMSNPLTSNEIVLVSQFIQCFVGSIKKIIPVISEPAFGYLQNRLYECFENSMLFLKQNIYSLRKLRKLKRKTLLATSLGNPLNRLFCAAWRITGGEVIGFTHGNSLCNNYSQGIIFEELSIANKLVTTSFSHKMIYKHFGDKFSRKYIDRVKFAEINNITRNHYRTVFAKLQKDRSVNKINKVMVVGFPKPFFFFPWFPEHNIFSQLHLEIQAVKILKKAGFYVIYKPHPITMNDVGDIFKEYVDEIINEDFEKVYNLADCILYIDPNSSTFKYSLLSKKPLVLINVKGKLWYPKVLELLKKRCCLVDAYPDNGMIIFDERELVNAVESSLNNIDYEILYEFAF